MATRTSPRNASPPTTTPNAQDKAAELFGDPVLGHGFDRIVHTVFQIDPYADYALVEAALDPKGTDPSILIDALDHAETAARTAHRLLVNAKLALELTEGEIEVSESALRERARIELEGEKAVGERKKAITNDDVRAKMAQLFPVDVAANRKRLLKAKGTVEHLERCADLAKLRIRTLDTLVGAARR